MARTMEKIEENGLINKVYFLRNRNITYRNTNLPLKHSHTKKDSLQLSHRETTVDESSHRNFGEILSTSNCDIGDHYIIDDVLDDCYQCKSNTPLEKNSASSSNEKEKKSIGINSLAIKHVIKKKYTS